MDYRTKHPSPSFWKYSRDDAPHREIYPFEGPNITLICEFIPPDASTTFLALYSGAKEDENFDMSFCYYLIEARRDCPMRRAFEIGDITWEDYWSHKGWLIEAVSPSFSSNGYMIRYIHPSQMQADAVNFIAEHSDKSPIQLKYETLCRQRKGNRLTKEFARQLEEIERDFSDRLNAA